MVASFNCFESLEFPNMLGQQRKKLTAERMGMVMMKLSFEREKTRV